METRLYDSSDSDAASTSSDESYKSATSSSSQYFETEAYQRSEDANESQVSLEMDVSLSLYYYS